MTSIEPEVKPTNLLRRLADTYDLLIGSNRHWHAAAVTLAIEYIENQLRREKLLKRRIAELEAALDAECVARDRAESEARIPVKAVIEMARAIPFNMPKVK